MKKMILSAALVMAAMCFGTQANAQEVKKVQSVKKVEQCKNECKSNDKIVAVEKNCAGKKAGECEKKAMCKDRSAMDKNKSACKENKNQAVSVERKDCGKCEKDATGQKMCSKEKMLTEKKKDCGDCKKGTNCKKEAEKK